MNSNITGFKRQRNSEDESLPLGKRQLDGIPCMKVLLVDGETAFRVWMQGMLASLGIETVPVYSAQHAIIELETHDHRGHFDFIFIDWSSKNALEVISENFFLL